MPERESWTTNAVSTEYSERNQTVFGHQTQPVGHIGIVHQMGPTVEVVRLAFVELFALPAPQKPLVHLEAAEQL